MARIMESDEEYLDRVGGDGTPEGNFALADGYNRMANAEVEAYNSRPAPADWNGALRHQEEQNRVQEEQRRNAAMAEQIGANRGVYDGYVQMGNAVSSRRAQYINNANAHLASALRIAAENGGKLPQYSWQGLGGALGLDGKNGAIIGGGYDRKGGFTLMVARRNQQTGQVEQVPMSFSPRDQYGLMVSAPGIFSRQEVDGMRGQLINNFHMHPDQVPQVPQGWGETGNVGIGNRTADGGTSVNPNWLYGPQRRSSISAFGADGRGGFSQYESNEDTGYRLQSRDFGTRAPDDKGRWNVLSSGSHGDGRRGTRYENDKTGEVVFVPEGQTLENVTRGVSDKERIARLQEEGRNSRAAAQNETKLSIADLTAQLKQLGYEVDEKKLAEAVRHNQATEQNAAAGGSGGGGRKFDPKEVEFYENQAKRYAPKIEDVDGNMVDNPNSDPARHKYYMDQIDRLGGYDGGEAMTPQQKAQMMILARQSAQMQGGDIQVATDVGQQAQGTQSQNGDEAQVQDAQAQGTQTQAQGATNVPTSESIKKSVQEAPSHITEDDEGMRTAEIANYDYLSDEDKKSIKPRYKESETDAFDESVVNAAQKKANEAKAAVDAEREKEEAKVRKALSGKGWTQRRIDRAVERHMREWDDKHDADTIKKNEENEALHRAFIGSFD